MNKDELVVKLAEEFGISTIDIYQLVNTVVDSMSRALTKGKAVNISEFGKFKILTKKDENGKSQRTVSFSPVKKFAYEINFRYNDLNPTPIGVHSSGQENNIEEISEVTDTKKLPENINPSVMDNKDKYDENIIRDNLSQDSSLESSSDSLNAFIMSKLESPGSEKPETSGIKEFELPHNLIELHNDITNEGKNEGNDVEQIQENLHKYESLEITDESADIEELIEERKKVLEEITPDYEPEKNEDSTLEQTTESVDLQNIQIEDRDKLEEFQSFEDERNAELGKIIAERNKIIEDIQFMVNNTDEIPTVKEKNVKETPVEKVHAIEKPEIKEELPLQEDRHFEHKVQYEESNLLHDNFDPIVTEEEAPMEKTEEKIETDIFTGKVDYTENDILIPEDTEKFQQEYNKNENTPKSFEDVFETKDETKKQAELIHSSLPETDPGEIKKEVIPPPVVQEIQKPIMQAPPPPKKTDYENKVHERERLYEEKDSKSKKKAIWVTSIIAGVLILIIYLAYNTGSFNPPPQQTDNSQQNKDQQNTEQQKTTDQNNQQQTPPVAKDQEENKQQENKQQESKQEQTTQQTEKTTTPTTTSSEEVIFDQGLNVAFIKSSDGIYIQTASFKTKSDADKQAAKISAGNKEVFVKEADLGEKGTYFRVRIGKFTSMEEAKEFARKLK